MFLTPSYIVMSQFAYFMRFLRFRRLIYLTINTGILFIFNYVIKHIYGLLQDSAQNRPILETIY